MPVGATHRQGSTCVQSFWQKRAISTCMHNDNTVVSSSLHIAVTLSFVAIHFLQTCPNRSGASRRNINTVTTRKLHLLFYTTKATNYTLVYAGSILSFGKAPFYFHMQRKWNPNGNQELKNGKMSQGFTWRPLTEMIGILSSGHGYDLMAFHPNIIYKKNGVCLITSYYLCQSRASWSLSM
jgi:hypothetical protein